MATTHLTKLFCFILHKAKNVYCDRCLFLELIEKIIITRYKKNTASVPKTALLNML